MCIRSVIVADYFEFREACVAFPPPDLHSLTSMLSRATYIYTYSGDAPMDAGWSTFLCMKNHNKPKQINGLEDHTGESSKRL